MRELKEMLKIEQTKAMKQMNENANLIGQNREIAKRNLKLSKLID